MGRLRSRETDEAYIKLKESGALLTSCALCNAESIKEFSLWRIIDNRFPYDGIAEVHHMLIPKRHASEDELVSEERAEYEAIKRGYVNEHYEFTMDAVPRRKSIPAHAHTHLIVENKEY
jgi:hypothetical protein